MYVIYCYINTGMMLYFSNIDNAGAFTTNDRPSQMGNKLTINWTPATSKSQWTGINCTTAVQTIVSRTGWASDNGMRCALFTQTAETGWGFRVEAYDNAPALAAKLDITYTAGGGASHEYTATGSETPTGAISRLLDMKRSQSGAL
jgi:hypothetical protein